MISPRDPAPQLAVPVNPWTGAPLTELQTHHLDALTTAIEAFYEALHYADGTTMPGDHQEHTWSRRRIAVAATHIETALMYAHKAVLE